MVIRALKIDNVVSCARHMCHSVVYRCHNWTAKSDHKHASWWNHTQWFSILGADITTHQQADVKTISFNPRLCGCNVTKRRFCESMQSVVCKQHVFDHVFIRKALLMNEHYDCVAWNSLSLLISDDSWWSWLPFTIMRGVARLLCQFRPVINF